MVIYICYTIKNLLFHKATIEFLGLHCHVGRQVQQCKRPASTVQKAERNNA